MAGSCMARFPNPCIVVPGITASNLLDEYELPHQTIWSVVTRDYERASLHPDNLDLEAVEPSRVTAGQIFEVAYKELVLELRFNLRSRETEQVPVFPFGYDWPKPIIQSAELLERFIDEVIARTKLLRHYDRDGYGDDPRVNLIGHSMGGLVIAEYLARAGRDHKIGKVATLATPFRGSFEAVTKLTTGTANLGAREPSSREREAARITPALYQLLPSLDGTVTGPNGEALSLLDIDTWQPSILDTLKSYVQEKGLNRKKPGDQATELLTSLLRTAAEHRERVDNLSLAKSKFRAEDWLCVVGAGSPTRVRLAVTGSGRARQFRFSDEQIENQWEAADADQQISSGDGTVPLAAAVPGFLPRTSIVCVTSGQFGTWEIQDRLTSSIAGFHAILANMDMLHRLIVCHFKGSSAKRLNISGYPLPGISGARWSPPVADIECLRP